MTTFGQKFTKGDRVRVTAQTSGGYGREGTVTTVEDGHSVQVLLDGNESPWWFIAWELEPCGDVQEGML